jgi:hypothetical protein
MEAHGWIAQPLQGASLTVKTTPAALLFRHRLICKKGICAAMALAPVALSGDSKTLAREGEK